MLKDSSVENRRRYAREYRNKNIEKARSSLLEQKIKYEMKSVSSKKKKVVRIVE